MAKPRAGREAQAIDAAQFEADNELNQLYAGESQGAVIVGKLICVGLVYLMADSWEDERSTILWVGNALTGGIVVWNFNQ